MQERRGSKRVQTHLPARWESASAVHEGKIIDISSSGCFILTAEQVRTNELSRVDRLQSSEPIVIEVKFAENEWMQLYGEVIYKIDKMGFAVRFTSFTDQEMKILRAFIEKKMREQPKHRPFSRFH